MRFGDKVITSDDESVDDAATYTTTHGRFAVELFFNAGPKRERLEQELLGQGTYLPLSHRLAWARMPGVPSSWFVAVRSTTPVALWGFALKVTRSRALPGHLLLRAERLRAPSTDGALEAAIAALGKYARAHAHILRISLELLTPDPQERNSISRVAADAGFRQQLRPLMYTETLVIDLRPSESDIFASFHSTARRHTRAAGKRSLTVQSITDPVYVDRMAALSAETMARTRGSTRLPNWASIIALSDARPDLSRVAGLFRTDAAAPSSLLAVAWGRHHGDHADYATAASTRTADNRTPLGYAPAWDLMRWAKQYGATWFDFGGITPGHFGEGDPVGGISDFKRYFGGEIITVGEEWALEPRPVKAKIANKVSAGAAWVRSLFDSRS